MTYHGLSDIGKTRKDNEDSFVIKQLDDKHMFAVVADGMGGHVGGKQASSHAVKYICDYIDSIMPKFLNLPSRKIKQEMINALNFANGKVFNEAIDDISLYGMGTTVVLTVVFDKKVYILNVGDSRLYLINDSITQVTKDHSYVNELIERGVISTDEADTHPQKNIITRAIGTEPSVEGDIYEITVKDGDKILACTDGLSNMVSKNDILACVREKENTEEILQSLISTANDNGGLDNITAVLVSF